MTKPEGQNLNTEHNELTNMKLSKLIALVGDENVEIQNLGSDLEKVHSKGNTAYFTFRGPMAYAADMLTEAPEKTALIVWMPAARVREASQMPDNPSGAELIAAERVRQIEKEGWTADHDDGPDHADGELAAAGANYAWASVNLALGENPQINKLPSLNWPWEMEWWKPSEDPVRNLVKAGALIAAEIDRLLRQMDKAKGTDRTDGPESRDRALGIARRGDKVRCTDCHYTFLVEEVGSRPQCPHCQCRWEGMKLEWTTEPSLTEPCDIHVGRLPVMPPTALFFIKQHCEDFLLSGALIPDGEDGLQLNSLEGAKQCAQKTMETWIANFTLGWKAPPRTCGEEIAQQVTAAMMRGETIGIQPEGSTL